MDNNNNNPAKFLLIDGKANVQTPQMKEQIDAAEVVFVGLKLIKNSGSKVYDRVGTLMAKSEIDKIRRKYHRSEIAEIPA